MDTLYDHLVITWIAVVDTIGCFFMWKMLQQRQKEKMKRFVSLTLRKLGIKITS